MTQNASHIDIILGPTASGKSAFAIDMARKHANESGHDALIINADAMQCYDCLHVLTAQPDADETAQVPHALYGFFPPENNLTVIEWRDMATAKIQDCFKHNIKPILVGGTGFYIKALTEGFSPLPEIDPSFREQAYAYLEQIGPDDFHAALTRRDPESAARIPAGDTHRMIRAWEVFDATQKPLSAWQKEPLSGPPDTDWSFGFHAILPEKEAHLEKINSRLSVMLEAGALNEVEDLADRIDAGTVPDDALVIKAHGFRPLHAYLREDITLEDAFAQTAIETRQYAKRQKTWIRTQVPADKLTIHTP